MAICYLLLAYFDKEFLDAHEESTRARWRRGWPAAHAALGREACVVVDVADHSIAGLEGTFESEIRLPSSPDPGIQNYQNFLEQLARRSQRADVIATKKQHPLSAIYPDDYFTLAMEKADILICHEAPSRHPHGYTEIDELAQAMGAKMVVHGASSCVRSSSRSGVST